MSTPAKLATRTTRPLRFSILLPLLLSVGCALVKPGGAKKDEAEAQREAAAEREEHAGAPLAGPVVDLPPDGFGESRLARVGDAVAEGLVLVALAALVTGIVQLFRRRLPLLGLVTSAVALLLAFLAFLKSWT